MRHYRRPSALCQAFVKQAEALAKAGEEERSRQFLAFALGYMTHLGTDTVAHSFVNEQCGGPFRNHPQRHHVIENHIDAWNYRETGPNGKLTPDPWGHSDTYPDVSMAALWFDVQITPDDAQGEQRPDPLPDDPAARKKALDKDGEMPDWMAESIVLALMDCFQDPAEHPHIYQGDAFQAAIDDNLLTKLIEGKLGMKRSDVYIGNVLCCRPPGNRDPLPDEIEACKPFLKAKLELIRPRLVVALGNFAAKLLTGSTLGITKLREREFKMRDGTLLMCTFHPAAALRGLKHKLGGA